MYGALHCKKRPGHWRLLLDNADLFSPSMLEVGPVEDSIKTVANDIRGISFDTLLSAKRFANKGKVKALAIDGIHPSDLHELEVGNYPLYRVFSVSSWSGDTPRHERARKVVDFLVKELERVGQELGVVSAAELQKVGWKFSDGELVGPPEFSGK